MRGWGVGAGLVLVAAVARAAEPEPAKAPTPAEPAGPVKATGPPPAGVGPVVRREQASLKSCYEDELRRNPLVHGRIVVELTIAEAVATEVRVSEDTTGSIAFGACIVGKMRTWRFDGVADGPARTTFAFTSED